MAVKDTPRERAAGRPKRRPLIKPKKGRQPQQQSTQQQLLGWTRVIVGKLAVQQQFRVRGPKRKRQEESGEHLGKNGEWNARNGPTGGGSAVLVVVMVGVRIGGQGR